MIDARSGTSERPLTQELLEGIPVGRIPNVAVMLVPGATTARPDVGGSETGQTANISIHGSQGRDLVWNTDGLNMTANTVERRRVGPVSEPGRLRRSRGADPRAAGGNRRRRRQRQPGQQGRQQHAARRAVQHLHGQVAPEQQRQRRTDGAGWSRRARPRRSTTSTPASAAGSSPTSCGSSRADAASASIATRRTPSTRTRRSRSTRT